MGEAKRGRAEQFRRFQTDGLKMIKIYLPDIDKALVDLNSPNLKNEDLTKTVDSVKRALEHFKETSTDYKKGEEKEFAPIDELLTLIKKAEGNCESVLKNPDSKEIGLMKAPLENILKKFKEINPEFDEI